MNVMSVIRAYIDSAVHSIGHEALILLLLGVLLTAGFLFTRITNKAKLPKVSGYIVAGIIIGPYVLGLLPFEMLDSMGFVGDVALSFIAFGVGRFLKAEVLKRSGKSVIIITLAESIIAGILVTVCMYFIFHLDIELSLLLGAIATATAPASTMMTIKQYRAEGEFVDKLLQVVALDDVVCLLVFSMAISVVNSMETGSVPFDSVVLPIIYNILAILLGALFGIALKKLLWPKRSRDNRLIVMLALLLFLSGICVAFDISPLMACMVFGTVYMNTTGDEFLFDQIDSFTPPIMLLFFVISGAKLNVGLLASFGIVGCAYFIIRIIGKYIGSYIGCLAVGTTREIRLFMGAALVPQAGVAIGLCYLAARALPAEIGDLLVTIILSSSVLYELIGPASAKIALMQSGAIKKKIPKRTGDREKA